SAYEVLSSMGVSAEKVDMMLNFLQRGNNGRIGLTANAKRLIEGAVLVAAQYGSFYIGTEHLLFAMAQNRQSKAYEILNELGVDPGVLATQVAHMLEENREREPRVRVGATENDNRGESSTP